MAYFSMLRTHNVVAQYKRRIQAQNIVKEYLHVGLLTAEVHEHN